MEKLSTPAYAKPVVDALRKLIRTGIKAAPNLETSPLITLPAVMQLSGADATPAKRVAVFISLFEDIVKLRLDGKDAKTAAILFGLHQHAGKPIHDRYMAVARLYNRYWTWENFRKEPLTRHLLAIFLALEREVQMQPAAAALHARSGFVGQDWVMETIDSQYTLPFTDSQPLEVIQTRKLRAISDDMGVWRHYAQWRERGIAGVPDISLFGPGKVSVLQTHVDAKTHIRTYITEVVFPKKVRLGETIEFTLVKRAKAHLSQVIAEAGWDWYGLTMASPVQHASIGMRFPPHKRPKDIWRYEDMVIGILTRPGVPTAINRLTIDDSGYVTAAWDDLSAGYSYGIAFRW